jgi:hypothetical protein
MADRAPAVLAVFDSADLVVAAARRARELGHRAVEAYTPFPIAELDEALALGRTKVRWLALAVAFAAGALALFVVHWTNAVDYPLNVGGRPLDSLPADVPIVFESVVLLTALAAFAGVLVGSGLPRLHHPVFEIEGFERTTIDRFWLVVADAETAGERTLVERELVRMGAVEVREAPP